MVFAPAFSLANPGSVTLFDITQPSKYVKEFKTEMVMYYDSLALNRKDMEVYMLGVGGPDIWLDIWNPETLELKQTVWLMTTFGFADYQYAEDIHGGILFGIFPADASGGGFAVDIIDRINGTLGHYVVLPKNVVGIDESCNAYDAVHHRYFISAILNGDSCAWVVVDMEKGEMLKPIPYECADFIVNVQYAPSTDQLIGVWDDAEVFTVDVSTGKFHDLFNVSVEGDHRILGPSMIVHASAKEDVYYTQLSTGAPVQTHLISVTLRKGEKPTWKPLEVNPFGDIFNGLAPLEAK